MHFPSVSALTYCMQMKVNEHVLHSKLLFVLLYLFVNFLLDDSIPN